MCVWGGGEWSTLRSFSSRGHLPGPSHVIRDALVTCNVEKGGLGLDPIHPKDELTYTAPGI